MKCFDIYHSFNPFHPPVVTSFDVPILPTPQCSPAARSLLADRPCSLMSRSKNCASRPFCVAATIPISTWECASFSKEPSAKKTQKNLVNSVEMSWTNIEPLWFLLRPFQANHFIKIYYIKNLIPIRWMTTYDDQASSRLPAHSKERNMILKVTTSAFLDVGDLGSVIGFSGKYQDKLRKTHQSINEISINLSSYPAIHLSFFLSIFFTLFLFLLFLLSFQSIIIYQNLSWTMIILKENRQAKKQGKAEKTKKQGHRIQKNTPKNRRNNTCTKK